MKAGDVINDRYLLESPIGRGSFGEVWMAKDQKIGLKVAVKIYIALDTRGIDEFKNEFRSVYMLHHPNLLKADYFDSVGNNPYLVMPYCPGSAGDRIGDIEEVQIWKLVRDVASGLAYLHSKDIVHRDIKPDNILIEDDGTYVISDFGLSTRMRSTLRRASGRHNDPAGQSGTIGYMAPELFTSNPEAVKATDIWALGATIYELATGNLPFCGQGGVMELRGAERPKLPKQYSKQLSDLMKMCLAREPWDRPKAEDIMNYLTSGRKTINTETVSRQTHENEIEVLRKIIENERVNHQREIESLKKGTDEGISKGLKLIRNVWAWLAFTFAISYILIWSVDYSDFGFLWDFDDFFAVSGILAYFAPKPSFLYKGILRKFR